MHFEPYLNQLFVLGAKQLPRGLYGSAKVGFLQQTDYEPQNALVLVISWENGGVAWALNYVQSSSVKDRQKSKEQKQPRTNTDPPPRKALTQASTTTSGGSGGSS